MSTRHVGQLFSTLALAFASFITVASCGSSGNDSPTGTDASTVDGSGPTFFHDGGTQASSCTPGTCAELGFNCGVNGNGCGGTIDCHQCPAGEQCGIGGYSKCGNPAFSLDSGVTCKPKTCADLGYDCGQAGDGCGNSIDCGGTAACSDAGAYCGGGGFNKCGNATPTTDAGPFPTCVPSTCLGLGYRCGMAADGCGGTIGPCGSCTTPLVCGAGGQANTCGSSISCTGLCQKQVACDGGTPTTLTGTVRAGLQEGTTSWVPSGTTPDPVPGVLVYIPTTALAPFDSNPNSPQVACSQCGADVSGSPLVTTTTDYNGHFTLTNVPVSATASDTIPIVIQLGKWRRQYSFAITHPCAANTLPQDLNLPSKSTEGDIPLTAISTGSYDPIECVLLKMGVAQSEFTSYSTWNAETASGTTPKPGRIHIYTASSAAAMGNGSPGSTLAPSVDETALMGTGATGSPTNGTYMMYDQILLPCWGDAITKTGAELSNLGYYGDHGGHFFATHYSYSWLNGNTNSNLTSIAQWDAKADVNDTNPVPNGVNFTGNVSNAVPVTVPATNPGMFVKWLNYVGALANANPAGGGGAFPPANPTVTITAGRHDVDKILNQSVDWIDGTDPNPAMGKTSQMLLHFTFDMPIPTASAASPTQCGHGIYSDFHVVSANQSNNTVFPAECDTRALTSQERIIEYMIWDLASCVPGPPPSTCTPKTCADYPTGTCGQQTDGCSGLTASCGTCPAGQICGGTGPTSMCVAPPECSPLTCVQQDITCGPAGDGCGNLIASCGTCTPPQTCGGGGVSGQCGGTSTCVPKTCKDLKINCGPAGDGCGNLIASCGTCTFPQTCGGGGVAGQCGGSMAK
jgi:hypothetical protein